MSARLNMNSIRYESWKGKTFHQITTFIKYNKNKYTNTSTRPFFSAQPLNGYRRELLVDPSYNHIHNPRTSSTIDEFNGPGMNIVVNSNRCGNGLDNVLDMTTETNKYNTGVCTNSYVCIEQNAKRRVRSSGMARKTFNPSKNDSLNYFSDTKQYLTGRNLAFERNFFYSLRQGAPSILTDGAIKSNIYSSTSLSDCKKVYIYADGNNDFFYYIWIDDTFETGDNTREPNFQYKIQFETGYYDVESFNNRIQKVMESNGHYLINNITKEKVFFVKLIYNVYNDKLELQLYPYNTTIYPQTNYSIPNKDNGNGLVWEPPSNVSTIPCVRIIQNEISVVTGFNPGYYPDISSIFNTEVSLSNLPTRTSVPYATLSQNQHFLFPTYKVIHYKPNNVNYGQQGAVSSSTRTLKEKYDNITTNGSLFAKPFGKEVANALAYGISENAYTIKNKIGFPLKKTPVFSKYTGQMETSCSTRKNMFNG